MSVDFGDMVTQGMERGFWVVAWFCLDILALL
jgi:hypothetical protein